MNWRVEFTPGAVKDIERLSTKDQRRILKRVALKRIQATRFRSLFMHVVFAKPLHTFARHALEFLNQRVSPHPNPKALAKRLTATRAEAWRFRVGDYRIIAQFLDSRLVVLVVEVGNRREVYR